MCESVKTWEPSVALTRTQCEERGAREEIDRVRSVVVAVFQRKDSPRTEQR